MSFDDDLFEIEGLLASTNLIEEIRKQSKIYYGDDDSVVTASEHSRRLSGDYDVILSRPDLEKTAIDFTRRINHENPELKISNVVNNQIGISKRGRR